MQPDLQLRAAARAIYDACYPSEEWAPYPFEQAERFETVHYRNAVGAAQRAQRVLTGAIPVVAAIDAAALSRLPS